MPTSRPVLGRRAPVVLGLALLLAGSLATGVWAVVRPPSHPPAYTAARPVTATDGYAEVTHDVLVAAPPEEVWAWTNDPSRPLADLVHFEDFPAVVATQALVGEWVPGSRVGDRRRVEFADGHFLAEEVLVDDPGTFRYVVWGFTNPSAWPSSTGWRSSASCPRPAARGCGGATPSGRRPRSPRPSSRPSCAARCRR
nr:hypothetical protein [Desertihabitans aurantiacus]